MNKKKIAVISDIHGNSMALTEVIRDIKNRDVDIIINLGDSLYGPLDLKGTFELLVNNNLINISGNQDRIILENLDQDSGSLTLEYVKSQLNDKMIDWLRHLPFDTIIDNEIYGCHATPQSDTNYLLEKLEKDHVAIKNKNEIDDLLKNIKQKIVICGHSHVANIVETGNKLIVNPGSVGLPAYDDEFPIYHTMQNYNPRANYSIINIVEDSISIDRVSLDYDFEESARLAETNKRHDWAKWIRTGIV